jgi:hypothetical protein
MEDKSKELARDIIREAIDQGNMHLADMIWYKDSWWSIEINIIEEKD